MTEGSVELSIKAALTATAFVAITHRRESSALPARKAGPWLLLLAALSALAYFNVGISGKDWTKFGQRAFHGSGYVHHWETFHYVLGSKYFPELGYDGLYAASLAAEKESHPESRLPPRVRDLRTNLVVERGELASEVRRVRARFSDERWREFVSDHAYFIDRTNPKYMGNIRKDHGYNPSPFWTFVARVFDAHKPIAHGSILGLTIIDPLLLALMFFVIFRTYGARVGCITLIIFGLGYPWRFHWVGGAFLRYDWLAATVMGVCALKKERFSLAGALLAYAALVRVFPVLFVFGLGVVTLRAIVRKEPLGFAYRFAGGYAAALVLGVIAGSTVGHGFEAWPEFIENSRMHTNTWLTNNIGLQNVLLYGPDTYTRRLVDHDLPDAFQRWHAHLTFLRAQMMPLLVVAMGVMLVLTGAAAWRATPSEAVVLGIVPCFSLVLLTCYYWSMLLLIPLRRGANATLGVLVLSSVCILAHGLSRGFEIIYGICSLAMLALFLDWIWPDAIKTLRREPVEESEIGPQAEALNPDMV